MQKLDEWSDNTIKNFILGKIFIKKHQKAKNVPLKNILSVILLTSIYFLLLSLTLPQFANDRFGIGIIILICFFILLINLFLNNISIIKFNTIDFLIIIFLLICIISTAHSYFFKQSMIGFLKYILFFLGYLTIKLTLLNSSNKVFLNLYFFIFLCAFIVSLIGIYQYVIGVEPLAGWEDPNFETIHTRVYSTLGNPNLLAGYLITIFPLGLTLLFENRCNLLKKIFLLMGSISILLCLIFAGSRGAYLGLLGMIFLSITILSCKYFKNLQARNIKFYIVLLACLVLVGALVFLFPIVKERLLTIFTLREHSSNSFRINVWLACLKMLKDNFLLGIGPGNSAFRLAYGLYMLSGFDALASYNIFLEIAIEVGIFGLIVFALIFIISFIKLHYLFWINGKYLAFGIFISLIGLLIHGLVDTVFFRPQIFILFWFLIASIDRIGIKNQR